jgi:hypothetical protein
MTEVFARGIVNPGVCSPMTFSGTPSPDPHSMGREFANSDVPDQFFAVASPTLDSEGKFETETAEGMKISITV